MRQGFRHDEAERILTEASRRVAEERTGTFTPDAAAARAEVSPERLRAMAEELGIPLETLEAVLRDRDAAATRERETRSAELSAAEERRVFIRQRHAGFYPHLWAYVGVIGFLFAVWRLTTPHMAGPWMWPVWPALGWGLGLFFHAVAALPTRGAHFEHEFDAWRERRRRSEEQARKRAERAAKRRAEKAVKADKAEKSEKGRG